MGIKLPEFKDGICVSVSEGAPGREGVGGARQEKGSQFVLFNCCRWPEPAIWLAHAREVGWSLFGIGALE